MVAGEVMDNSGMGGSDNLIVFVIGGAAAAAVAVGGAGGSGTDTGTGDVVILVLEVIIRSG